MLLNLRLAYLLFLFALTFIWGMQAELSEEPRGIDLAMRVVFAIAVVKACTIDTGITGRPILHIVQFLMLWTWPVAAPAYVLWARRWGGLLWLLLIGSTMVIAYAAGAMLAILLIG